MDQARPRTIAEYNAEYLSECKEENLILAETKTIDMIGEIRMLAKQVRNKAYQLAPDEEIMSPIGKIWQSANDLEHVPPNISQEQIDGLLKHTQGLYKELGKLEKENARKEEALKNTESIKDLLIREGTVDFRTAAGLNDYFRNLWVCDYAMVWDAITTTDGMKAEQVKSAAYVEGIKERVDGACETIREEVGQPGVIDSSVPDAVRIIENAMTELARTLALGLQNSNNIGAK